MPELSKFIENVQKYQNTPLVVMFLVKRNKNDLSNSTKTNQFRDIRAYSAIFRRSGFSQRSVYVILLSPSEG